MATVGLSPNGYSSNSGGIYVTLSTVGEVMLAYVLWAPNPKLDCVGVSFAYM